MEAQSMERTENRVVIDRTANPAPLGLLGFGMTTVLLNLHNADIISLSSVILSMGIFYGGLAQVMTGLMEWKKGNTFGTTAFTSYGLFWFSLVGLLVLPEMGIGTPTEKMAMGFYLLLWGVFTVFMFIGTLRMNRATQFVFASLALLFFVLALGDFTGMSAITVAGGLIGLVCGSSAIYTALATVLNGVYQKSVLPLGELP